MRTDQTIARAVSRSRFILRLGVATVAIATWLVAATPAAAEVLIRWDEAEVPSAASLGISTLVIPADNGAAIRRAIAGGYRVYLEVAARALSDFIPPSDGFAGVVVRGQASAQQLALLGSRVGRRGRVITLDERGKWPHIRSNWVTRNGEVLQVSNRSAQPWIESNAALMRIIDSTPQRPPAKASAGGSSNVFLTYTWHSEMQSELDEGPETDNYLVAIAEAGSFGGDLLLPLHKRFETDLLLGLPPARDAWQQIQRYLAFYSWELPSRYAAVANIGVATADPIAWFEVMNLLSRHNLPFQLIAPPRLSTDATAGLDVLIVLNPSTPGQYKILDAFARRGGTVVVAATSASARSASEPHGQRCRRSCRRTNASLTRSVTAASSKCARASPIPTGSPWKSGRCSARPIAPSISGTGSPWSRQPTRIRRGAERWSAC